jgi:hypothetical protein
MENQQIATTILLPAAVSFIVSIINNKRQKDLEFRYDYRKYILEKRKEVYNSVEKIINELMLISCEENGKETHAIFDIKNENPFQLFNNKLIPIVNKAIWLSDDMFKKVEELNMLVLNMEFELPRPFTNNDVEKIASKNFDRIKEIAESMATIFFEDICSLDDISKFKRKIYYHD